MQKSELFKENEFEEIIGSVVEHLESKGFEGIRANHEGYEPPSKLIRKGSEEGFTPDVTAKRGEQKCYFEVVAKAGKDKEQLISKWTMLSAMAQLKDGSFYLVAPKGKLRYANQILKDHSDIEADIINLKYI